MKIKVAILGRDKTYLSRLVLAFNSRYTEKLEMYSFTQEQAALEALTASRIDVFLADDSYEIDNRQIPGRCGFAYLVDSAEIESFRGQQVIHKFQKADLIYRQILSIYAENVTEITGLHMEQGNGGRLIAYLAVSGGTGASTIAAASAIRLARKGKKVLYLNLERFGSSDVFFQADGTGSFQDIIYAIKSRKGNLSVKLESVVKQDPSGVWFYSATATALDMAELNSEEIRNMIANIKMCGAYDYIILDMDFSLEKSELEILRECAQIVMVGDGSPTSNGKLERVMASMRILEEQNDWKLLIRCSILYNRFSSRTSEKAVVSDVREVGGIKRYEGYTVEQLLRQLAEEEVLDKLY